MSETAIESNPVCRYCGVGRHPVEQCPRVASIEYVVDASGAINRIWFHARQPGALVMGPSSDMDAGTVSIADLPGYLKPRPGYRTMADEHAAMKFILRKIARLNQG